MNERIRELAKQAGEYVNSVYTPPVRSKEPGKIWEEGHIGWHEQFHAKFAELLIKECIAICTDIDGEDNTDARSGRQDCAVEIKEHFGVEE